MSWTVLIYNFDGCEPDLDGDEDAFNPLPLGQAKAVTATLESFIPDLKWDPEYRGKRVGTMVREGFVCQFTIPVDGPVDCIGVGYSGTGDPLPLLERICTVERWSALDVEGLAFIQFGEGTPAGLQGYRSVREASERGYNQS